MTKITTATALALLLGLALPAAAQQQQGQQHEMQDEGTVATVDHLVLTTEEGERYTLAGDAPVQGLEPGTRVRITYREQDGEKVVTGLAPAPQQ